MLDTVLHHRVPIDPGAGVCETGRAWARLELTCSEARQWMRVGTLLTRTIQQQAGHGDRVDALVAWLGVEAMVEAVEPKRLPLLFAWRLVVPLLERAPPFARQPVATRIEGRLMRGDTAGALRAARILLQTMPPRPSTPKRNETRLRRLRELKPADEAAFSAWLACIGTAAWEVTVEDVAALLEAALPSIVAGHAAGWRALDTHYLHCVLAIHAAHDGASRAAATLALAHLPGLECRHPDCPIKSR